MKAYREFRPTGFDPSGLALEDQQDWLVVPVNRARDSGCVDESNFDAALKILGGEGDDVEVHRFGHWACGWFEIIIVRPESAAAKEACDIEAALDHYPILDDSDLSERETEAADRVWRDCYTVAARIEYIRRRRSQFSFGSMAAMVRCVRGEHFLGYANELLG